MNKILATLALTGLIATLPALASAHDRGHHYRDGGSHHRGHHDSHQHRGHRAGHYHAYHYDVYRAPVVYYPAPRMAPIVIPAIPLPPLPHVNIVWRAGH